MILFLILAAIAVTGAMCLVFIKSPMYSIYSLIGTFFSIAGLYVLLNAQFLGIVQIIVYSGAIMVLFLYVLMMLNQKKEDEPMKGKVHQLLATLSGGLVFIGLIGALRGIQAFEQSLPANPDSQIGLTKNLGKLLFSEYVLPFELAGVLFMSALVGAVIIGKREI